MLMNWRREVIHRWSMACTKALANHNNLNRPMTNALVTDTLGDGILCDDCHVYHQVLSSLCQLCPITYLGHLGGVFMPSLLLLLLFYS
jgi:hypothetical protein